MACPDGFTSNGGTGGETSCYIDLEKGQVAVLGFVIPGLQIFDCTTDDTVFNFREDYKTGYYCPGGRFYYLGSVSGFKQCHPLFRHGTSMISSEDECLYSLEDSSKLIDSGEVVCGATDADGYFGYVELGNCQYGTTDGYTTTYGDLCGNREQGQAVGLSTTCH